MKAYKNSKTSSENSNNGLLPLSFPTIKKLAASRLNQWKNGSKTNDQREMMPAKNTSIEDAKDGGSYHLGRHLGENDDCGEEQERSGNQNFNMVSKF